MDYVISTEQYKQIQLRQRYADLAACGKPESVQTFTDTSIYAYATLNAYKNKDTLNSREALGNLFRVGFTKLFHVFEYSVSIRMDRN